MSMDFYDRVKELVKDNGLSLISFLESIGINYSSYKSAKQADNLPRADEAVKIAKALNTTVEFLVTGETSISGEDKNLAEQKLKDLKVKLADLIMFM